MRAKLENGKWAINANVTNTEIRQTINKYKHKYHTNKQIELR